jgi:hypothetical protein
LVVDIQDQQSKFIIVVDSCSSAKLPFQLLLDLVKFSATITHPQKLSFLQFARLAELLLLN